MAKSGECSHLLAMAEAPGKHARFRNLPLIAWMVGLLGDRRFAVALSRDITERKQAEKALNESLDRWLEPCGKVLGPEFVCVSLPAGKS